MLRHCIRHQGRRAKLVQNAKLLQIACESPVKIGPNFLAMNRNKQTKKP